MEKPIVLVIMDGVGKGDGGSGDAVKNANTPTLDHLLATCPHTYLKAHGTAVGLARCMSPLPGRSCCPTLFPAMPCISWACCPMATSIPTSPT